MHYWQCNTFKCLVIEQKNSNLIFIPNIFCNFFLIRMKEILVMKRDTGSLKENRNGVDMEQYPISVICIWDFRWWEGLQVLKTHWREIVSQVLEDIFLQIEKVTYLTKFGSKWGEYGYSLMTYCNIGQYFTFLVCHYTQIY